MGVTILLSLVMMGGFFLMLYSAVALIQDKRLFGTAPGEVLEAVQPKEERFPGMHALGWALLTVSVILLFGPIVAAAVEGIRAGFSYWQFFTRFVIMLLLLKAFDIVFFDWVLLCRSNFFSHYYPEVKDLCGPWLFGYNKKSHMIQIVLFVAVSFALTGICTLF